MESDRKLRGRWGQKGCGIVEAGSDVSAVEEFVDAGDYTAVLFVGFSKVEGLEA